MAGGGRQLRLLLWKDYLTRKRNFITLAGILWAATVMLAMYIVRINIDNEDIPTCQFPARALPSAGMLPFLQSFICSVGNECSPLDKYEEIPAYTNAKFTTLRRQMSPLLNESVLALAATTPGAVKLLATAAHVADEPTFRDFTFNGLTVGDLFTDPSRVKRYVTSHLRMDDDVANTLMTSRIALQGLLKGDMDRCSVESVSHTLIVHNKQHMSIIVQRLCALTADELQKIVMDLVYEINYNKYIEMLGNMYYKLSGDDRITQLGDFLTAMFRMTKIQHFLPPEITSLFLGQKTDFTYLDLNVMQKFLGLFQPTFGDTDEFKSIQEFADVAVISIQYMDKIFSNLSNNDGDVTDMVLNNVKTKLEVETGFDKIEQVLKNAASSLEDMNDKEVNIDAINVLTQLTNFVYKFLPRDKKHEVLFYSTLLSKLMECAHKIITNNMHIEERVFNVTLRNPTAIKILKELPPGIVGKAFDALVSAERTQILTSKLSERGQMFCDLSKLQNFFLINKTEAESIKDFLCTDAWKNYVSDIISTFGISEVKDNINNMASLFIQETLGKDTTPQLYSIDKDFQILKNFTSALVTMEAEDRPGFDWKTLLGVDDESDLMKTIREKAHLGKLMLISAHGALAKEIIKQNAILQYKITPILLNANTIIVAFNDQLNTIPADVTEGIKKTYGDVIKTMLLTALDKNKTYKSLSTYCEEIFCNGGNNAEKYLNFPTDVNFDELSSALCDASVVIEKGMRNDSIVAKAIVNIRSTTHTMLEEVNWTKLIDSIQKLYLKLDKDYPYLFDYLTYSMDNTTQENIHKMYMDAKNYWFSIKNLQSTLHLSLKLGFRLFDIINHDIFKFSNELWMKIRFSISSTIGPLRVLDDTVRLVTALLTNSSYTSNLPPKTVNLLSNIIPNLPQLIVDSVNIIVKDNTDVEPIVSLMNSEPAWPCSDTSLSSLVVLTPSSQEAVRALETLMCMEKDIRDEWLSYMDMKKAVVNKTLTWNTTNFEPHLFLEFSSLLDSLINDTTLIKDALHYILDDNSSDDHIGLKNAWDYAVEVINTTDRNHILRKFLHKVDYVVNSINTSTVGANMSTHNVWQNYFRCTDSGISCTDTGRSVYMYTLRMMSVILDNIAIDLTTYFTEVNEPDSNIFQVVGFTKNTALYMLYDRFPEFAAVMLNSYWDYGFMSQIRRASQTQFWDCEAVVSAMIPPPGSSLQISDIDRIKPYVCPSFIYWLSLPRDDNVLFNLVAKPQYFFYSMPVENSTSKFESAFTKSIDLIEFLDNVAKESHQSKVEDKLKIDTMERKLNNYIDNILNYKLNKSNPSLVQFSDVNRKQFISHIYLTRIVMIVNKIASAINNITVEDVPNSEPVDKLKLNLKIIKNIFNRKSVDAIAILYDVLTDVFWTNDKSYTIVEALDFACNDVVNKSKTLLVDEVFTKEQLCAKDYKLIFDQVQNVWEDDYEDARQGLLNLVNVLNSGENNVTDVFSFLNSNEQHINSLKNYIKYSYELGLPVYLKYIQSNLQSYNVIITFLSGGEWWKELRGIIKGPYTNKFFGYAESSFEIAGDFLNNLDGIRLVRLAHDLNLTDPTSFCQPNITLGDYIPDGTHMLSELKAQLCFTDKVELFKEIPSLMYTSQGYEPQLLVSKDVDYQSINNDISLVQSNLASLVSGPKDPQRPPWITDQRLEGFRRNVMNLLSKESIAKVAFGAMGNTVDAGTLFLNSSQCGSCSQLTSWLKQLNLQLFKKQEYDALYCRLEQMALDDVRHTLTNDFHWDMFIAEVISPRNYTKYELNKSMNEFLSLVKLHLLEDLAAPSTRIGECLAGNVTGNYLGISSLFLTVVSHTTKLLQAEAPHLQTIAGVTDLPYLNYLHDALAHNLDVYRPLRNYTNDLRKDLQKIISDDEVLMDVEDADVNLKMVGSATTVADLLRLRTNRWQHICDTHDCRAIYTIIKNDLNLTRIDLDLPSLQSQSYWSFSFASTILRHTQSLLRHCAHLLRTVSGLDLMGAVEGKMEALLDVVITVLGDDAFDDIVDSLQGLILELHPLLRGFPLENDLEAISTGLDIFHQLKTYLVEEVDLKLPVSSWFPDAEAVEAGVTSLGINHTNFWSLAAPRIHAGHLYLAPILTSKAYISQYVCELDTLASVVYPGALDVVTADDVIAATADQFCGLQDHSVKELMKVLLANVNFNLVLDKLKDHLLSKLYSASDLTPEEGTLVLERFPRLAHMLPALQDSLADIMDTVKDEPLLQRLKNFTSFGNLMSSSDFLADAGTLMCGKPFQTASSRIIKAVISSHNITQQPDQAQLDLLPTDFCRSMYKEVISMEGGKILWSFVKPLIMGRILYTPRHPTVDNIIHRVNATFSSMIQVSNLVHSFAAAFPSLDSMSSHRQGLDALQHLLKEPGLGDIRKMLLGQENLDINVDVDGMFEKVGDLKGIGRLLSKASSLLQCMRLDRLQWVSDEDQLMLEAAKLLAVDEFSAGIVFLNVDKLDDSMSNVEYKIRMDIENAPTTKWMKPYLWTPGPMSSFIEDMRYFRGLIQIQDLLDSAVIHLASRARRKRDAGSGDSGDSSDFGDSGDSGETGMDWAVYTQQEPYPCYRKDFFQSSLYESQALIVGFFFAFLFSVASMVRFIVADKETGNTMLMSVMGVDLRYHSLSWFISCVCELSLTILVVTVILRWGSVLPRTDPTLLFALLFVFALSVISFSYMMSRMFSSASFAAVCAALAYLMTFMPFILILSLEAVIHSTIKMLVCLSMSSSLLYSFLFIGRYEAMGVGARWAQLWAAPNDDDMCIGYAAGMMILDALLYLAIGYCLDRRYGIKRISSSVTHEVSIDKAGVSVQRVTKTYGRRRALRDVSLELREGEVTALLGHNGAGKTTLVNILMGMCQPTSGRVTIRSRSARGRLGVCPQRDVLHEHLTAREHIALYAQLMNPLTEDELKREVDRMLSVLSLGAVSDVFASRLSGGTRRRLCVALAFVGQPTLVSLDEPTSGVDPSARRDIWSMIVKLKQGRTILLTTHHLDEAELLSDQIIIMHKGEIHTSGTPMEIKRNLGSGYKLSVTYPHTSDWQHSDEESAKELMGVVRGVVRNAALGDVTRGCVEVTLPFYDDRGEDNDFEQVCSVIERSQQSLGVESFALECSTLEQVFTDICLKADAACRDAVKEQPSKSTSSSSLESRQWLVASEGPRRGSRLQQFLALMHARAIHLVRNRWLLFMLIGLPSIFVIVAMSFATLRPPADNEIALRLSPHLYPDTMQYLVPYPSLHSESMDPSFAQHVMNQLKTDKTYRNWTEDDTPSCVCTETYQQCSSSPGLVKPELMLLPSVDTLNTWLLHSQEEYIENRYGGFTSTLVQNKSHLVAWYNNQGYHALPSFVNALNNAILRTVAGEGHSIVTYSHPMKISKEQISKSTVYQHIADAGISAIVLMSYSLVSAGGALYVVSARRRQEKRLQLLCGVTPLLYWAVALTADCLMIAVNVVITAIVMWAFGFPVFVMRHNLPAICILLLLYGFACGSLMHVLEKLFSEASLANMVLFTGNTFLGLAGITLMLILDLISDSDATDNARWVLHKVWMVCPQFALADGMIEIAKNTIQAQVLSRFGMETYRDPLSSSLILPHYCSLLCVGILLIVLNMAIEGGYFHCLMDRLTPRSVREAVRTRVTPESDDVIEERRRVLAALASDVTHSLPTLGNINRGFVHTEGKDNSLSRSVTSGAATQLVRAGKAHGARPALRALTLAVPRSQCIALLGENGAGKSTTFSLLTGESRPTTGHIYLDGVKRDAAGLCRGLISYCPQSDAVDPLLTVRDTLRLYCRLRGIADTEQVLEQTLEWFELSRYGDTRAAALSGGNRRKLCAALALGARAPLVLLDEPTSGMDVVSRGSVWRGVWGACAAGRGVLLSTHALADARQVAHHVALLRAGELVARATLDECLSRFGGGYVVVCRCADPQATWRRLSQLAPHAVLTLLHQNTLHLLFPATVTVDNKEVRTRLSSVFGVLSRAKASGHVSHYTLNTTTLEQMFLSFTDKAVSLHTDNIEVVPHQPDATTNSKLNLMSHETDPLEMDSSITNGDLHSVTSL